MTKREMIDNIHNAEYIIKTCAATVDQLLKDPTQPITVLSASAIQSTINNLDDTIAEIHTYYHHPETLEATNHFTFFDAYLYSINKELKKERQFTTCECNLLFCMQRALFYNYAIDSISAIRKTKFTNATINIYYKIFGEPATSEQLKKVFYAVEHLSFTKTGIHFYKPIYNTEAEYYLVDADDLASSS